jgi:hypothetical protein
MLLEHVDLNLTQADLLDDQCGSRMCFTCEHGCRPDVTHVAPADSTLATGQLIGSTLSRMG